MFQFTYTATTHIYTLSLHDALPIYQEPRARHLRLRQGHRPGRAALDAGPEHARGRRREVALRPDQQGQRHDVPLDRKSTRLNSSHMSISYAVFCLKKKTNNILSTAI